MYEYHDKGYFSNKTIRQRAQDEFIVNKSRFIGYALQSDRKSVV